jgi:3-hydroxyisobutyrate dehydrogenase
MATIGFIGLGNMGAPMAANLVKAGHAVRGFDVVPAAQVAARQAGAAIVASAAAAAAGADVVITMLPAGQHVREVYDDPAGPLPAAAKGTLFVDCSTIDVPSARAAHAAATAAGMASLDAPVSGGVAGAAAASLTFMVGGEAVAFARAQPVLAAMGRRIVHCGEATAGQAAKICNNMILGVSMIAVGEAFVLAEKLGLSAQALFDVASTSSGQCWALTSYCPVPGLVPSSPANNSFRPGFAAALMVKDLTLAQEAAQAAGAETELGRHAAELYARFSREGNAGKDFSGIIEAIRAWSGGA